MNPEGLVFAKLTNLDLCLGKCPNGHRHIFGFPHQLRGTIDLTTMTYITRADCRECGCEVRRRDQLAWAKDYLDGGLGI